MQLYIKAIQLKEEDSINRIFIFRVSELHTVFAFWSAMGTYIGRSGLDEAIVEDEISGPVKFECTRGDGNAESIRITYGFVLNFI